MIIAVEGLPGSGKTTTAELVGQALELPVLLERTAEHPFLASFYSDPQRYALETELVFAVMHYSQFRDVDGASWVADFSPAKDAIFARMNLAGADLELFEFLHAGLSRANPAPQLVVYLDAPMDLLMARLRVRGRPFELGVSRTYWERLRTMYEASLATLGDVVVSIPIRADASRQDVAEMVMKEVRSLSSGG